jgi:hypothetical protein
MRRLRSDSTVLKVDAEQVRDFPGGLASRYQRQCRRVRVPQPAGDALEIVAFCKESNSFVVAEQLALFAQLAQPVFHLLAGGFSSSQAEGQCHCYGCGAQD